MPEGLRLGCAPELPYQCVLQAVLFNLVVTFCHVINKPDSVHQIP